MPSLKDLKNRIDSVKNTQKITKAMKMVAAAKLRRAQERAEQARPYTQGISGMLHSLLEATAVTDSTSPLLTGTGADKTHLLVVATSDRGLCGGFNSSIIKAVVKRIEWLEERGKTVKLLCVGAKGGEVLKRNYNHLIIGHINGLSRKQYTYEEVSEIADKIVERFNNGEFDVCTVFYNRFKSAMTQIVTPNQIIPLDKDADEEYASEESTDYEYEPSKVEIIDELVSKNIAVQIYHGLLENSASEQGARMTAMDNATRNAGEMIKKLTLQYNRTRQAAITTELTEIISGAEAL